MHILVIGAGHIGRRHIRNLLEHPDIQVTVADNDPAKVLPSVGESDWQKRALRCVVGSAAFNVAVRSSVDGAIIATPTATHVKAFNEITRYTYAPLLIEKPLALDNSEWQGDSMRRVATEFKIPVHVAYSMRFHPPIAHIKQQIDARAIGQPLFATARVGQYLPDWHPDEDYRNHYVAHEDQGGGALLDLSHEIDYLNWMFGPLEYQQGFTGYNLHPELDMDADQLAHIVMESKDGIICTATMDLLDRDYNRHLRVVGSDGTLEWSVKADGWERDDQFQGELDAWLHGIQTGDYGDLCTLEEGLKVLQLVDALKDDTKCPAK